MNKGVMKLRMAIGALIGIGAVLLITSFCERALRPESDRIQMPETPNANTNEVK